MISDLKIAVIDNGVNEQIIKVNELSKTNRQNILGIDMNSNLLFHGTNCVIIIHQVCANASIYSYQLLNDAGMGNVNDLKTAFDWCLMNNICLVNLSLGTTHFRDKSCIRNIVNHYANKGLIIVAASANSGYKTYPASFSNVIGVVSSDFFDISKGMLKQKGIDFVAPSNHEVGIDGNCTRLAKSNSYAAPYVTAVLGNIMINESCINVCVARNKLASLRGKEKVYYLPDWIEKAWISEKCGSSKDDYYFTVYEEEWDESTSLFDTIVINDKDEFEKIVGFGKSIVYLGKEPIECSFIDRHFWCREHRISQIMEIEERNTNIEVPIIISRFSNIQDSIWWINGLKKRFAKDGYNVYSTSCKPESVLYDLEFIPEEFCEPVNNKKLCNFLCWQTYYCQSDAILFALDMETDVTVDTLGMMADIVVDLHNTNGLICVAICCEDEITIEEEFVNLDEFAIDTLYQKILGIFTEDADE